MKKIFLLSLSVFYLIIVQAQPGKLDPSFAGKGWTFVDMPKGNYYTEIGHEVLQAKNNKYIIVFEINGFTVLVRHLANGSLDSSFGIDGYSEPVFITPSRAVLQPDGKIVVAGSKYNSNTSFYEIALIRFKPDGTLDKTFDGDGIAFTSINGFDPNVSLAIQTDGKIVVAGSTVDNSFDFSDFIVARFNQDGSSDKTFGNNGRTITDFGNREDHANAIALQKDGKIVVVGTSDPNDIKADFAIARYNQDGFLDKSFKGDGKVNIDFGGYFDVAYAVAIQNDGKMVVAGMTSPSDTSTVESFALIRYGPDGALDKSFGANGKVTTSFKDGQATVYDLAIQTDGKIVAGGSVIQPRTEDNFALARYNKNGSLDNSFSSNGRVTTNFGGYDDITSLLVQSDGKIVAAGTTHDFFQFNGDIALARYSSNGSLDQSFSVDGKLQEFYPAGASVVNAIAVQKDGKIITGGYSYEVRNEDLDVTFFALARYKPDGTLDKTFGDHGIVNTRISDNAQARSLALQKDGKIIAAGISTGFDFDNVDFAVARYNIDGSLDSTFGNHGIVTTDFLGNDYGNSVVIQNDNKIVLAGFTDAPGHSEIALTRYNINGSLDKTFDGDGKLTTEVGMYSYANAVVVQDNNNIVITGSTRGINFRDQDIVLVRYKPDGSLDKSFNNDGVAITNIAFNDEATALAIQEDKKIVVAGHTYDSSFVRSDFIVVRYLSNGDLDKTFNSNGKVRTNFRTSDQAYALAIQNDGKIIVGGTAGEPSAGMFAFALARYNPDGSLDKSFGGDGKVISRFGQIQKATSLYINQNRLYVGGKSDEQLPAIRGILAAYQLGAIELVNNNSQNDNVSANLSEKLSVSASPNPSNSYFTITLQSSVKNPATLTVVDEAGRIVETRTNLFSNSSIQIGHQYRKGIYYVKIVQGNNTSVLKLMKNSD